MVVPRAVPAANCAAVFAVPEYLAKSGPGKALLNVARKAAIFRQSQPADSIFYIHEGRVRISVTSMQGKEATLALLGKGDFIGEECIVASQFLRLTTATAILPCTLLRIDSHEMRQALAKDQPVSRLFQSFLLARCALIQADLIDHLLHSSEKRLARILLSLAQLDASIETADEAVIPRVTQTTLAEMIGTTRSRVSFFMNRFRKLGYIQYDSRGGVKVYPSLFDTVLEEQAADTGRYSD